MSYYNNKYALLVPCYNAAPYIHGFLENIAKLAKPFDEIIFYDDASEDDTFKILIDEGHTVLRGSRNNGPGFARNKLAEICSSNWFHFHDIDDFLDPLYLDKTAKIAESNDFEVILCNVNWYDSQTNDLTLSWKYNNKEITNDPLGYTIANPIGGINGLYKKDQFFRADGFNADIRVWEDADLHVRLAGIGSRFHVIEEFLSYSIRYATSASADQTAGWKTRLGLLQAYCHKYEFKKTRKIIGQQAQNTASMLILSGQLTEAKNALRLSEDCGVRIPLTNGLLWFFFKRFLPRTLRIYFRMLHLTFAFKK
ncbi:glycosyltransferase family 2 protein [Pedobacter frigidisoli]|uniref:Glycosyltransferase family 2 protein n=1 Tax=Pedobacter frigidisoli TaxID=2530455 RepID=A0A4R0P277_9SPHI|nr:glycosyltransferase family A protein [Pedobacter frigidisoli]TCD07727.1 glycosyltransferase family 2 protein [Pedobacter frigidisoli]